MAILAHGSNIPGTGNQQNCIIMDKITSSPEVCFYLHSLESCMARIQHFANPATNKTDHVCNNQRARLDDSQSLPDVGVFAVSCLV